MAFPEASRSLQGTEPTASGGRRSLSGLTTEAYVKITTPRPRRIVGRVLACTAAAAVAVVGIVQAARNGGNPTPDQIKHIIDSYDQVHNLPGR